MQLEAYKGMNPYALPSSAVIEGTSEACIVLDKSKCMMYWNRGLDRWP